MANNKTIIPSARIERAILMIRGHKVMLDADLAYLYGVTTKRLNEQVKRNRKRFPNDFMFQLTPREKAEVVAICDHLSSLKFSPALAYAFTEHGAIMLASVLNSRTAAQVSIQVVRASSSSARRWRLTRSSRSASMSWKKNMTDILSSSSTRSDSS